MSTTTIKYTDLVETVAAALQYISYYHPADFIAHLNGLPPAAAERKG